MDTLPEELWLHAFSFLDGRTLGSARLVSKAWSTRATPIYFRQVRLHGCKSGSQHLLQILDRHSTHVNELLVHWDPVEDAHQLEEALALLCKTRSPKLGLVFRYSTCSACGARFLDNPDRERSVFFVALFPSASS
ncbi:hypothetical protein LX32DRAFT_192019 [Colletotrichum zoysiae]|uniref:F-box domain-containing protein n=1 Tax=Colletotrichum zoysiae TaxID=1216348 RepID=A0AAD9LUF7_9PEZI|nr:hypothetical protein LX32DRAFT_192019 [Colletotrichum zoysiae]